MADNHPFLSSPALTFLAVAAAAAAGVAVLLLNDPSKKARTHGLRHFPFVGNLPSLLLNQHRFLHWTTDVILATPTLTMSIKSVFLPGVVTTANPANVEHILKTNFDNYPVGDEVISAVDELAGQGIFNSDGEQWRWQRKVLISEFTSRSLREFVAGALRREIGDRLVPLLAAAADERRRVDLQDVLERLGFDSVCEMAFGVDPGCLAADAAAGERSAELMKAFGDALDAVVVRLQSPASWRLKKLLNVGSERRLRESLPTVRRFAESIVAGAGLADGNLLSRFAAAGGVFTAERLAVDVVINFLLAGRDTTSSALTWFFYVLSSHPAVELRIVEEVRSLRKTKSSPEDYFSFDELRGMSYVHAAITESMRLYPPVWSDFRECAADDVLPDGTFVGKGWTAAYSAYAMGRSPELWGDDCLEFRPERWLDGGGAFRPASPFKYAVFHAGPRTCLGKEMAYLQMKAVVACVVERFHVDAGGAAGEPWLSLTMKMKGGMPVDITKRAV